MPGGGYSVKGSAGAGKKIVVGVWGYYESQYYCNKIFITPNAAIGDNLLKPLNDLYSRGLISGVEFVSLDLLTYTDNVDAYIFFDFPKPDNPLVRSALASSRPKILLIFESPLILPQNWHPENHEYFDRIFSYRDDLVDNIRHFRIYCSADIPGGINRDLSVKDGFCVVIAGYKLLPEEHELSLYPERIKAIRWFEKNHPEDLDLYGFGWNKEEFPSYKGVIKTKRPVLQKYRFSICYENVRDIPGYITEKIMDCLFAGCVPVYWGANNITDHIPESCFIDMRKFGSYEDLYKFISEMSDETYSGYLSAIEEFLKSEKAKKFSIDHFVDTLISHSMDISGRKTAVEGPELQKTDIRVCCEDKVLPDVSTAAVVDRNPGLASLFVLAFGKLEYTRQCVESIIRYTREPYELILVDNGSQDDTCKYFADVAEKRPGTIVVRHYQNRIVEAVVNHILSIARGEFVVGITNDTLVHEGWLDNLIRHMEKSPNIAIVGPRSNNISGPQQLKTDYRTIEEYHEFTGKWIRQNAGSSFEISRMVGVMTAMRKSAMERIGGFDPNLPTNGRDGGYGFSDDDITMRLLLGGYRLLVANDVLIHHYGSVTSRQYRPDLFGPYQNINMVKYRQKLSENPRISVRSDGEMTLNPYDVNDNIPVPDTMRIRFPRTCVALINEATEMPDMNLFCGVSGWYPVSVMSVARNCVFSFLKNTCRNKEYDYVILLDGPLPRVAPHMQVLVDVALRYPDVAITAPLTDIAPVTHRAGIDTSGEVELIPYGDLSVCAMNLKIIGGILDRFVESGNMPEDMLFLQRRIRGEGWYIGRANNIVIRFNGGETSHSYEGYRCPEELIDGDIVSAAAALRADVRRDATFYDSIYRLGLIYLREQKALNAVNCFNRVLELDPDHVPSLTELARIYLNSNDMPRVRQLAGLAYMKQPWNPEVQKLIEEYQARGGTGIGPQAEHSRITRKQTVKGQISAVIVAGSDNRKTVECAKAVIDNNEGYLEIIVICKADGPALKELSKALNKLDFDIRVAPVEHKEVFSKSVNRAIESSGGEFITLMSDEIILSPGCLSVMRGWLERVGRVGVVMPVIVHAGREVPSTNRTILRDCRLVTDKITGPCVLIKRALLEDTGPLREDLKNMRASLEEYCFRVRMLGHRNLIALEATVTLQTFAACYSPVVAGNSVFEKYGGHYNQGPEAPHYFVLKAIDKAAHFTGINEPEKAIEVLVEGIKFSPDDERLYFGMIDILFEAKRYEEAEEVLSRIPGPETALRLTLAGQCKDGIGRVDEAIQFADRALALDKDFAPALNLKGAACYRQGNIEEAGKCFKAAIAANPDYGDAYTLSGLLELEKGNSPEAIHLLERGFLLSPLSADATDAYYMAATQTGSMERFVRVLGEVVYYMPEVKRLTFLLIQNLLQLEKFSEALNIIEQAICLFGVDDGIISAALAVRETVGPAKLSPPKGQPSISACMIIKNEQENLPKCLYYASGLFDEIVVVDTGSQDRSRDIAVLFGAGLYEFEWNGDFSAARNESISKASGNWIFVLDADEVIAREDFGAFRAMTMKGRGNAFNFTTRNYVDRSNVEGWTGNDGMYAEEAGMGWLPSFKVRLFPNVRGVRFENPVHELVENTLKDARIKTRDSNVPVHHYGKLDEEKSRAKGLEYYNLGKIKLNEKGDDVASLVELALQAAELKKYDEAFDLWHRLLKIDPKLAKAHFNLSYLCLKLGRYQEGIIHAKKALELVPGLREAALNYASCEFHGGDINEAIIAIEKILQSNPNHPSANALLGMAYFAAGNPKLGKECMERIKKMNADCPGIVLNHAIGLRQAGRTEFAISLIENAAVAGYSNAQTINLLKELKGI
jgi:tetratricopeptide (TPR) repeat protein/GT2 family glycosyltransferase